MQCAILYTATLTPCTVVQCHKDIMKKNGKSGSQGSQAAKKRKTNYKRKAIPEDAKAVICYCPQVCPDVMRVQLQFVRNQDVGGGGTASSLSFIFRGNSCFDPDISVIADKAMGFDQWAAFYRRYRVLASKITYRVSNTGSTGLLFGVVPLNTSGIITDKRILINSQYEKHKLLGTGQGTSSGVITHYMPTNVIRSGPPNLVRYEEDYSALTTTVPSKEWFWNCFVFGQDSSDPSQFLCTVDIDIEYMVEFYDRQTLPLS